MSRWCRSSHTGARTESKAQLLSFSLRRKQHLLTRTCVAGVEIRHLKARPAVPLSEIDQKRSRTHATAACGRITAPSQVSASRLATPSSPPGRRSSHGGLAHYFRSSQPVYWKRARLSSTAPQLALRAIEKTLNGKASCPRLLLLAEEAALKEISVP